MEEQPQRNAAAFYMTYLEETLFTDDFAGSTGAGWSGNWWASATYGAVNLDGSGLGRIVINNISTGAGGYAGSYASGRDMDFKISFRPGAGTGHRWHIGFIVAGSSVSVDAARGTLDFTDGIMLNGSRGTNYGLKEMRGNVMIQDISTPGVGSFSTSALRFVRFRKEGTVLMIKKWNSGDEEPTEWNWTGTVQDPDVTYQAFVSSVNDDTGGTSTAYFDDAVVMRLVSAIDRNVDAPAATGSGLSPSATASIPKGIVAEAATGTGLANDAVVWGTTRATFNSTDDGAEFFASMPNYQGYVGDGTTYPRWFIKTPDVVAPNGGTPVSAALVTLFIGSGTVTVHRATSAWGSGGNGVITPGTTVDPEVYATVNINAGDGAWISIDVSSLVQDWQDGDPNHGLVLKGNGNSLFVNSLRSGSGARIELQYIPTPDAVREVAPFVGSALAVDPTLEIFNPDYNHNAEPGYAHGWAGNALFERAIEVAVEVAEATGEILDATTELDVNGFHAAEPFIGSGRLDLPEEARRDEDDPYFRRIRDTTDEDDHWFRLNEPFGSDTRVRVHEGGTGRLLPASDSDPFWNIEPERGIVGPVERRAVRLDGSQYITRMFQSTLAYPNPGMSFIGAEFTFETVIRTTEKDGILFLGWDERTTGPDGPVGFTGRSTAAWIQDGKVALWGPSGTMQSFKDIADGEWHHIVISYFRDRTNENDINAGAIIYIDGRLDIRRTVWTGADPMFIIPDHWYGAPKATRDMLGVPQGNFVGDVMETVYRYRSYIGQHQVQRLFYDAMGIIPFESEPLRGTAELVDPASARGNEKRILMLWFQSNQEPWMKGDAPGDWNFGTHLLPPHHPQYYTIYGNPSKFKVAGGSVFFLGVDRETGLNQGAGNLRRDPVTDLPRLLDLEHDVDVTDFDIIAYANWPDEGAERDMLTEMWGMPSTAIEDHLKSLRNVIDKYGISLWVSNPTLATELGIIETAELVSTLRETGGDRRLMGPNQQGFDGRVAEIWPYGPNEDFAAYDTHRNNKERLVASIPGLTDKLPWFLLDDAVLTAHFNPQTRMGVEYGFKYRDRRAVVDQDGNIIVSGGPRLGDEWLEPTIFHNDIRLFNTNMGWTVMDQYRNHRFGVPPGKVKAGTVLTKFGSTHWVGSEPAAEVENPYADYASSVVVRPGEMLNGKVLGGKILLTLGSDPRWGLLGSTEWEGHIGGVDEFKIQDIPEDSYFTERGMDPPTEQEREWDYSTYQLAIGQSVARIDATPVGDIGGGVTPMKNADGSVSYRSSGGSSGGSVKGLMIPNVSERWPVFLIKVFSTIKAGILWLGEKEPYVPGQRVVRVTPAEATAEMPKPKVAGGRSVIVTVTVPALGNGQMKSPDGYDDDNVFMAFPATGHGVIIPNTRNIYVAPATGSGHFPNPMVLSNKSGIPLFVTRMDSITLYLEEL